MLPTTVVGSYPQPDWLVDRAHAEDHGAARAAARAVARCRAVSQAGAGRRHAAGDPRHGARRHRHHHRRRDAARELFQPLRHRARRRRQRQPRDHHQPGGRAVKVPRVVGKIRRRRRSRSRHGSSCAATPSARPRSRCPGRSPWRSRPRTSSIADDDEMVMDFAAAVNAEAHDLAGRRRRRDPARRALAAQRPGRGEAHRGAGDQPRARGPHGADRRAPLLRLCGGGAARRSRPAIRSCPQLADCAAQQISIEAAQPKLDLGILADLAGKTIMLGVIDLARPGRRNAGAGGAAHPRRLEVRAAPSGSSRRRTAG